MPPPGAPPVQGSRQHPSGSVTQGTEATLSLPAAATARMPCIFYGRQPKVILMKPEWQKGAMHHQDKPPCLHRAWSGGRGGCGVRSPSCPCPSNPAVEMPRDCF